MATTASSKSATRSQPRRLLQRTLLASAIASVLAPVQAQDEESARSMVLEEVVVTVERRVQNLQDVAATVQAFDNSDLRALGINSDFRNLQYAVPGLQITAQEGKLEVFLRGIGSADSDFSSDPSVAVHYNGVYLPRPRGIGPLFFDSERVEVNKGPQGTLRGRNATGGTINIISNKPHFEGVDGNIQAGAGNFDGREVEGVINVPISDTVAARFAGWYREHDGLYDNAFPVDVTTPSAQDDIAVRASVRWEPSDSTTVDLQYFHADVESSGDPGAFSGRSLSAGFDIDDLDDPWDQYFRTGGLFEQEVNTVLLQASHDFGGIGIEYNGSYNSLEAYNGNASREWQLGLNFPGSEAEAANVNLALNDTFFQAEDSESFTQEIRFYSTGDGPLTWTAGAFYFKEEYDYLSWDVGNGFCGDSSGFVGPNSPVGPNTVSCWQNGLGGENRGDDSEVESLAFFGDATYEVTDRTRIKAGLRWTDEEKQQDDYNAAYQFNFNADYFTSITGINAPGDQIIGGPGFRLTDPGGRTVNDIGPGVSNLALFQDGIATYGNGDNWGQLLDSCREGIDCEVLVTSQFDPTGERGSARAFGEIKDDYVDWRVGVEHDLTDNNLLYATVSTGTRSGGFNRPLILADGRALATQWEPEELTVYEIGSKNALFLGDFPLRLNGSLFFYDYTEYVAQGLVDIPNPTPSNPDATTQQVFTDNVSDAEVFGIEVEAGFDLPADLNFAANILYLNAEFENSSLVDPRSNANLVVSVDGNTLPNVSDWNLNLRLSQGREVDWGAIRSFDWTINALYRSEFFLTPFNNKGYALDANGNTVEIPLAQMPAPNNNGNLAGTGGAANANFLSDVVDDFWIVNLNAGLNFGDSQNYRIDAYVENVFEEAFSGKGFVNSSVNIRYLNAPRIYGLRFRAEF